jgi:hypothetical protein
VPYNPTLIKLDVRPFNTRGAKHIFREGTYRTENRSGGFVPISADGSDPEVQRRAPLSPPNPDLYRERLTNCTVGGVARFRRLVALGGAGAQL